MDCACAVGLGFGPVVFTLWASLCALLFFNVFLTSFGAPLGTSSHEVISGRLGSAAEPAPPYLISRTKTLCTCTSNACFRSATGPSTGSLVGSSLEPAADLRRLRRAPGSGRFVHVFWVFVALCKALWCRFITLGGLLAPLWHLGLPF